VKCAPCAATDDAIAQRVTGAMYSYDGEAHRGLFALPLYLRRTLQDETRVITVANPIFMY
jgi:hypothetical protein